MQFRNIIGHEHLKQQLRLTVLENRVAHAQLFYGTPGIGKMRLALAYAQYVCCDNRTATDSCGTCPNCLQMQKLEHPDLHFVFPIVNKEKSGKSSVCDDFLPEFRNTMLSERYVTLQDWGATISKERKHLTILSAEAMQIAHSMSLKSYQADYKILIIWSPERMETATANKLLKLVEEPPEKTLIIMVSDNEKAILGTILSRTQPIHVPNLTEQDILAHLTRLYPNTTEQQMRHAAHIAQGSITAAQAAIENNRQDEEQTAQTTKLDIFIELLRKAWLIGNRKDYDALQQMRSWADDISKNFSRDQQIELLNYFQQQVRENYIYNLRNPQLNYLDTQEEDFAKKFARFVNSNNVEKINQELDLAIRHITQNVNSNMVFFDLALHFILFLK